VEDAACNDVTAELTLQSSSRTLGVSVPVTPIFESEYPNLDPSVRGQSKPIGYGTTWCAPLLVDTVEEIYLVADAAIRPWPRSRRSTLFVVAVMSVAIPANRAASIQPVDALRID
jgi:hypothetical protein